MKLISAKTTAVNPRDGDVYRFTYSHESLERAKTSFGGSDFRWCFDGQLVYCCGRLEDTYWGIQRHGVDGRVFTVEEALFKGSLEFVCNLHDVEKIPESEVHLYADGDAFNLSYQHGCYRHFVKRSGARKHSTRMREAVERMVTDAGDLVERAHRNLRYAKLRRAELLAQIEAGEEISL